MLTFCGPLFVALTTAFTHTNCPKSDKENRGHRAGDNGNGNGVGHGNGGDMTNSQRRAIIAIARRAGANAAYEAE